MHVDRERAALDLGNPALTLEHMRLRSGARPRHLSHQNGHLRLELHRRRVQVRDGSVARADAVDLEATHLGCDKSAEGYRALKGGELPELGIDDGKTLPDQHA